MKEWLGDVELQVPVEAQDHKHHGRVNSENWHQDSHETESSEPDFPDAYDIDMSWEAQAEGDHQGPMATMDGHGNRYKKEIESCLKALSPGNTVQNIVNACRQLSESFKLYPKSKDHFIRRHGVFSIIELLEMESADVVLSILQVNPLEAPAEGCMGPLNRPELEFFFGNGAPPPPPRRPPSPQTKVTIMGKIRNLQWGQSGRASFGPQSFGSQTPPPLSPQHPLLNQAWPRTPRPDPPTRTAPHPTGP